MPPSQILTPECITSETPCLLYSTRKLAKALLRQERNNSFFDNLLGPWVVRSEAEDIALGSEADDSDNDQTPALTGPSHSAPPIGLNELIYSRPFPPKLLWLLLWNRVSLLVSNANTSIFDLFTIPRYGTLNWDVCFSFFFLRFTHPLSFLYPLSLSYPLLSYPILFPM